MVNLQYLQPILQSYELPAKKYERMYTIAARYLEEHSLDDVSSQYDAVAMLIERFNEPWSRKPPISLDEPVSDHSNILYHEIIGKEDAPSENEGYPEDCNGDMSHLGIKYYEGVIDHYHFSLLKQLAKEVECFDPPKYINSRVLCSRLDQLVERFTINGKLCIPNRPIRTITISGQGVHVQFGRRDYLENPLQFLVENRRRYTGLDNGELKIVDKGLYESLRTAGQLETGLHLLHVLNQPHSEKAQQILAAYASYGGDMAAAERGLGIGKPLISYHWHNHGLPVQREGLTKKLSDEDQRIILGAYETYHGNSCQAAKHLPYNKSTIQNYWKRVGMEVPIDRKKKMLKPEERQCLILDAYKTSQGNCEEASKNLRMDRHSIRKCWVAAGLKPRRNNWSTKSPDEISRIINAYDSTHGICAKAAKDLGIAEKTVLHYWNEADLEITTKQHRSKSNEEIACILEAFETYEGNCAKAARELHAKEETVRRHWKKSGLMS
ncbi:hypothetical protein HZB02_06975 [Candidatus Woesearchaeota archaeon]|nr:hypothetical protein [Candidatus Woesearchaeota archaeon]